MSVAAGQEHRSAQHFCVCDEFWRLPGTNLYQYTGGRWHCNGPSLHHRYLCQHLPAEKFVLFFLGHRNSMPLLFCRCGAQLHPDGSDPVSIACSCLLLSSHCLPAEVLKLHAVITARAPRPGYRQVQRAQLPMANPISPRN